MFNFKPLDTTKLSDERLMLAIQNGDTKAFNELYKRYNNRLLYYFYRMLNNQDQAQDFVQELFYKIIDKPHLFDSKRKLSTWIFSMAHNMCKNEYRSRNVRSIVERVENTDLYFGDECNYTEEAYSVSDIFKCLNQFEEAYCSAFLLKYREGLSIDEISEVLGLAKGTVKSRLHYIRKRIKEELEQPQK